MKNQNQWFFSPDLAFLASLSSVFNSWKKKKMQRQINHRYCKKFKKPSLKNPLIFFLKRCGCMKKKPTLD
jgi:hypothetical protein